MLYQLLIKFSYRCNTTAQFEAYAYLVHKMYVGNETEIFMTTGCLSSCDKYYYTVSPLTNIRTTETGFGVRNYFKLRFILTTGQHERKEQVQLEREVFGYESYNSV